MNIPMIVLSLAGLVPLSYFIYRYFRYSPFETTVQGRWWLGQKIGFWLMMAFLLTVYVWPDIPGRRIIAYTIFGVLIVFFWAHLFLLLRVQKKYPWDRFERGSKEKRAARKHDRHLLGE